MNLSGKVLVVTGSDGVLGQAVAATLSGYGAQAGAASIMANTPPRGAAGRCTALSAASI